MRKVFNEEEKIFGNTVPSLALVIEATK
jgi:hypothetical protein